MQILKGMMLLMVFVTSNLVGIFISKKYTYRLEELEEIKNIFNIFKAKIRFTYEPLPHIFEEIVTNTNQKNIKEIFEKTRRKYEIFKCR